MSDQHINTGAFALYALPSDDKFYFLSNDEHSGSDADEFIFHPFDSSAHPKIKLRGNVECLSKTACEALTAKLGPVHLRHSSAVIKDKKKDYEKLVDNGITSINSGEYRKIVLSRSELKPGKPADDLYSFFFKLCEEYPNAFKLLIHHPDAGTWLMATPELLLSKNDHHYKTMALAGTWPSSQADPAWTFKEFEEQGLVLQYILQKIKDHSWDIKVSERYTRKSGPVNHLCNDIAFKSELQALEIAELLHPTPAVAGLPAESAIDFINKNEVHKRAYYCGYSGFIFGNEAHFFVNLRCMQVFDDGWLAYAGGGIVAGSELNKEWEETNYKLKTLWAVLEKM